MPDLDVSDVLTDPMFSQELVVKRRAETVGGSLPSRSGRDTEVSFIWLSPIHDGE